MNKDDSYKPRTLIIEWDEVSQGGDLQVFSRVKSMDHARKIIAKRNKDNMHKVTYIDREGSIHKIIK